MRVLVLVLCIAALMVVPAVVVVVQVAGVVVEAPRLVACLDDEAATDVRTPELDAAALLRAPPAA
jgi:hypothetical protein